MSATYTKLLLYFILILGIILIGVLLISFVELQKANNNITDAALKLNQTQISVNQTQLFLTQSEHEDKARDNQTKIEMQGRSNQTRVLINNTTDLLLEHHKGLVGMNDNLTQYLTDIHNSMIDQFKELLQNQSMVTEPYKQTNK